MNRTRNIPESILRKLRKGGRARAKQLNPELRREFAKRAWQTRIRRATAAERLGKRAANLKARLEKLERRYLV